MKALFTLITILVLYSQTSAQVFHKKEAKQLLQHTLTTLKNNDTAAFIKLWQIDNSPLLYHDRPFTENDIKSHFKEIRLFLDSAFLQKIEMKTDVEKSENFEENPPFGKYLLVMQFNYNKSYQKSMGFYADHVNGRWLYKFSPNYTILVKN